MNRAGSVFHPAIRDYGGELFVFNIAHAARRNGSFRTVLWTGEHLQLTLMSLPVGGEIGAEMHEDVDQFIRVESGRAKVLTGPTAKDLREGAAVDSSGAILIPAGTWHNVVNVGGRPLKLYSLYAPPQHPRGTVHATSEEAAHEGH